MISVARPISAYRLARAPLNSVAPFLEDRFAPSRRNCMAPRAFIGGGSFAPHRGLSSLASQCGVRRTRGKKVRVLRTKAPCRRSGSGQKKEGDGSWSRLFVLNVEGRSPRSP